MVDARTDVELLAATPGEPRAFGVFYGRHERSLLSFFRRCRGSAEVAADLTAETFANALQSLPGFRAELGIRGRGGLGWRGMCSPGAWSLERGRVVGRVVDEDDYDELAAIKRAEARTQATRRIQEPGGACYRLARLYRGP